MGIKMFSVFMITRLLPTTASGRVRLACILTVVSAAALIVACEKVPLLAPSGSTITLTSSTTTLPVNGTTTIIAQVLEAGGTPPHSGTDVTFTTTLGTIQPSQVSTDTSGRAVVTFVAGNASGTATITALSGGASVASTGAVKILVGTAAVGRVAVNANPVLVPALGGSSTISATVLDVNGNPLPSALVTFSTTSGTLSSGVATSDINGNVQTVLTTFSTATVTASVGAQGSTGGGATPGTGTGSPTPTPAPSSSGTASGTVTVGIASAPILLITPPTTAPNAGLPATYTFVVTAAASNGSAIKDISVNWGDGRTQDLGAFVGSLPVSHTYSTAQTFFINATLIDTSGNVIPVSTSVTVVPTSLPSVNITATVSGISRNVTFQIQVTVPTGVNIQDSVINYGDGTPEEHLGGINGNLTKTHQYPATGNGFPVSLTVIDSLGRSTTGTTTVNF
jgi:hypothetical protein